MNQHVYHRLLTSMIAMCCIAILSSSAQAEGGIFKGSIGTGVSYAPRYEGDGENELRLVPLLDLSYNKGKFFIGIANGIGINFSEVKYFKYGVRVTLGKARSPDACAQLYGMDTINYYPEGSLFASTRLGFLSLSSSIASSNYGTHADVGSNITVPLGEKNLFLLGASIEWGDSIYNQTYFGVTATQAAASGNVLTAYNATAGKRDTVLSSSWGHNFDKSWFSSVGLRYERLEGSAQISPITLQVSMISETLMLGYRF